MLSIVRQAHLRLAIRWEVSKSTRTAWDRHCLDGETTDGCHEVVDGSEQAAAERLSRDSE